MKKLLIILLMLIGTTVYCQDQPKEVYAQIVGTTKALSSKVTITIDFGARLKTFVDNRLKDSKTGKAMVFNSMIDALNYMGRLGWNFKQAYVITVSNQNVYHYLMSKPFSELDEETQSEVLKN